MTCLRRFILPLVALSLMFYSCGSDDPLPVEEPQQPTEQPTDPKPSDPEEPNPEPDPDPTPEVKDPKYLVSQLFIDTDDGAAVDSKEQYVKCTVRLDSENDEWDLTAKAGVRGRGNSSWLWYDKKPYRVKLDKKASIMGLGEGKSWVLLANYRDPTDLMNTFVFELGQLCGLPFTNNTRYVELTLNGKYTGLYQLTEQVQQGKGRVNVNEAKGYLLSLDRDDGPELSPGADDNFWSEVYRMPVCIKNPENLSTDQIRAIVAEFGELENAIYSGDYAKIKELMDVNVFMDYVMIQEFVYNVELDAPRSMYIHKDVGGKWVMGPLWDFDAGYDFDWSNMYNGHSFFADYRETVLGTDPAHHKGTGYRVPGFFSDMFKIKDFVKEYKVRWKQVSAFIPQAWNNTLQYVDNSVWQREQQLWPIGKRFDNEITRMQNWIANRNVYLSNIISNYPQ